MKLQPRAIWGTVRPHPELDDYLIFEPERDDVATLCQDGTIGVLENQSVNLGHPMLLARAQDRFGKEAIRAVLNGETHRTRATFKIPEEVRV